MNTLQVIICSHLHGQGGLFSLDVIRQLDLYLDGEVSYFFMQLRISD